MILDPNGIAAATGASLLDETRQSEQTAARTAGDEERTSLLVFRAGEGAPKAVPLALIARLEEIDLAAVERANGRPVVQYRGQLMPLVTVAPDYVLGTEGRQPVLVFADQGHSMGLLVDEIVDIVEERLKLELAVERPGLVGSAIVSGVATDIIDAGFYLTQASANWFGSRAPHSAQREGDRRVLLVDDSPFFRNLLTPLLTAAGYAVTSVDSADRALALCEAGEDFDAIISDIEMPGMDGFSFAAAVRNTGRWQSKPLVALSSHATPQDLDRGRAVGFDDYVAKFDREALLASLDEALAAHRGAA
jgi:two-component system chemotaxis sensor kinase CheA